MTSSHEDLQLLSELDLGLAQPSRSDNTVERPNVLGRTTELYIAYERDLTEADIEAASAPREAMPPRSLVRIHASHHALARCLAVGMKSNQAALITGYSAGRISQLQNDPAFQALCAEYRAEAKTVVGDITERMTNMSLDALELLQERMQDAPESFSIPTLLDLVKTFADRTGHGPNQEVHLKFDPNFVDRPPRETFEEWEARRNKELTVDAGDDKIH